VIVIPRSALPNLPIEITWPDDCNQLVEAINGDRWRAIGQAARAYKLAGAGSGHHCSQDTSPTPRSPRSRRPCSKSSIASFSSCGLEKGGMYLQLFAKPMKFFGARDHFGDLIVSTHEGARIDQRHVDPMRVHAFQQYFRCVLGRHEGAVGGGGARRLIGFRRPRSERRARFVGGVDDASCWVCLPTRGPPNR
jgi:hypothetical protein